MSLRTLPKVKAGIPDLHGSRPRHLSRRARCAPLHRWRPRQYVVSVVLIREDVAIDDANFSRTGEGDDTAFFEAS